MPGFKLAKKAYEVYLENPNIHGTTQFEHVPCSAVLTTASQDLFFFVTVYSHSLRLQKRATTCTLKLFKSKFAFNARDLFGLTAVIFSAVNYIHKQFPTSLTPVTPTIVPAYHDVAPVSQY
jgi:hypothetical protein